MGATPRRSRLPDARRRSTKTSMSRRMVAGALACLVAVAAAAEAPIVRYADDRLTVHAEHAPVAAVLTEVARATGATLRGAVSDREVTIDLRDVRLEEALDRLLGKDNFALVYASDGHVSAIELVADGQRMSSWPPLAAGGTGTSPGVSAE